MKKIITKFWGVALIVILLSTLFVAATPVSAADPLKWESKQDAPSPIFGVLAPGTDILDFDINGAVMYAATGATLMQSTSGGSMWSNVTAKVQAAIATLLPSYVAIAPDDPNIVVTANTTTGVALTKDGGTTWVSMGTVIGVGGGTLATINGLEVSPAITGGIRYVVVYGVDAAGAAAIYYYNYGAGVGAWKNAYYDFNTTATGHPAPGTENATVAFKFSPNFSSDLMALAVSANQSLNGVGDFLNLEMLNFNLLGTFNSEAGFPQPIYTTTGGALTVNSASLAMAPDYDGSDESTRIAFIGTSITDGATEVGGVFRAIDYTIAQIQGATTGVPINSVAYDGTNLAAGAYDTNNVWRCDAPLSSSPTFLGARSYKRIGIDDVSGAGGTDDKVQLIFSGDTLYGAKIGDASAISKSTDYGNVWNDYTMMDSAITTVHDLGFASTGDPWYIAADDGVTTSIYRISMFAATRVLCVEVTAPTQALRLDVLPTDGNVLYASDMEATASAIYYTDNGGLTRWFARTALPAVRIADVAVESATTIYLGAFGTPTIYKSTNKGFSWSTAIDTKMGSAGNNVNDLESIGEGQLVVGGDFGGVAYTKDGGTTWTNMMGVLTFTGPVIVTASGLDDGDYVFAAEVANKTVWRAVIGAANFLGEFKDMEAPAQNAGETNVGIVYTEGVLYTMSSSVTANTTYINSTLEPTTTAAVHTAAKWRTEYAKGSYAVPFTGTFGSLFGRLPEGLKVSSGAPGSIMLYAFNTEYPSIFYLDDAVALTAPTLLGPADDTLVQIVSPLTGAVAQVNFTWSRLSLSTNYQVQISLDENFDEQIALAGTFGTLTADPVSYIEPGASFVPGLNYYWRVRSITPFTSQWSEVRSFTVQPSAATVPTIASPEVGAAIDNVHPAFSWSPVAGATSYKFELAENIDFASPVYTVDATVAGAQLPVSVTLERGKTYFWRVKSLTPVESDWSTVANFVVAEEVVAPTIPPATETVITFPPATTTVITVAPPAEEVVNPGYIWAIIIIGAVLVIAVIVLIVRTRRSV